MSDQLKALARLQWNICMIFPLFFKLYENKPAPSYVKSLERALVTQLKRIPWGTLKTFMLSNGAYSEL